MSESRAFPWLCVVLLPALAVVPTGCKRGLRSQQTEEGPAHYASVIRMGDPKVAGQLVRGFHNIEARAWRWTAREFQVALGLPPGAAQKGATLAVRLTVPPVIIEKEGPITLTASIAGTRFEPETYSTTGNFVFRRDVPPNLLAGNSVRVEFALDKAMPPTTMDQRQLGIVVLNVALEPK
jgi:hypothetical protein